MTNRTLLRPHPHAHQSGASQTQRWLSRALTYFLLGVWSLFTIFALSWVVLGSFKTGKELFREPFKLPAELLIENYERAWSAVPMGQYLLNSILIVSVSLVILLAVSAPAAYVLSRVKFRGNNLLTSAFAAGMGVPYPLLFIPLFVIVTRIGVVNTIPGLVLIYVSLSIPFTVYLLTGFFVTLPTELEEAAVIDGCSSFQVFRHVMLPLARPGLITAAIFNGLGLWNEYQLALVFINDAGKRTLSLGLYELKGSMQYSQGGDWPGLFAGVVTVMIPTIILYIFLSEKMISGVTMGAGK